MEISTQKESERFSSFLDEENNINIIFSGMFGIGKTYFIHQFFDNKKDKYLPIYLNPVQYTVSNNEDIFEYIKVDILFGLMESGVNFEKTNFSFGKCVQMYLKENPGTFIVSLLKKVEKLGFRTDIIKSVFDLHKAIESYKEKLNLNEEEIVNAFLHTHKEKIGSIYEDNMITELIRSFVDYLQSDNKEVVLIIDDLDRIDPEHIFRILNILSVHENFCGKKEENKFGFDKTILICDIDNIKNIYSAKYGIKVDFNGYIDKFYSKNIYYFDNTSEIINAIFNILLSLTHDNPDIGLNTTTTVAFKACNTLLSALVKSNGINLRCLLRYENKPFDNRRQIIIEEENVRASNYPCLNIFDFIKSIFATLQDFEKAIYNLKDANFDLYKIDNLLSVFFPLADYPQNKFKPGNYNYNGTDYSINQFYADCGMSYFGSDPHTKEIVKNISFSEIIKKAFYNYKNYFI